MPTHLPSSTPPTPSPEATESPHTEVPATTHRQVQVWAGDLDTILRKFKLLAHAIVTADEDTTVGELLRQYGVPRPIPESFLAAGLTVCKIKMDLNRPSGDAQRIALPAWQLDIVLAEMFRTKRKWRRREIEGKLNQPKRNVEAALRKVARYRVTEHVWVRREHPEPEPMGAEPEPMEANSNT